MKKPANSKIVESDSENREQVSAYSRSQTPAFRAICDRLRELIDAEIPKASSKVWHGSPVWFVDDNPVVGYSATKSSVNLLFWNGQAFGDAQLEPVGKYRAAQAKFADVAELDDKVIRRWLKQAKTDVFDSRTFFNKLRESRQPARKRTVRRASGKNG